MTQLQIPITLDQRTFAIELEFSWHHDRFSHSISVVNGERACRLLTSREGDPDNVWPPSPPLQQLHEQIVNDQNTILAVGMSGSTHWSACYVADRSNGCLRVELAARIHANEMATLTSTFELAPNWHVTDGKEGQLRISHDAQNWAFHLQANQGHWLWSPESQTIQSVASLDEKSQQSKVRATVTWGFELGFTN